MKPKFKLIVLIALAAVMMATLVYVNLQNVRETPRGDYSSLAEARTQVDL